MRITVELSQHTVEWFKAREPVSSATSEQEAAEMIGTIMRQYLEDGVGGISDDAFYNWFDAGSYDLSES